MFFFRFWKDTRDRLFFLFGLAFWVLAFHWYELAVDATEETRPYFYAIRLLAFLLIIAAIIDKNRSRKA